MPADTLLVPPERPAVWIDDRDNLRRLADTAAGAAAVAIDTEANSMHAYREQTCIVQVTVDDRDAIVDALAFEDLDPLRDALARPDVEVVFHGGDYDIAMLTRDFDFVFERVFDTMIAATLLGEETLGLAALVERHFGVVLDKRFQRADWARRPLGDDHLLYLQRDTMFLPGLRARYDALLAEADLVEEAAIEFRRLATRRGRQVAPDPLAWRRIKGARDLDAKGRAVLHALHAWREQTAEARDTPPFKVLSPRTLLAIASNAPAAARRPADLKALAPRERSRYGSQVLAAVREGLAAHGRGDVPPGRERTQLTGAEARERRDLKALEDKLRAWRREAAAEREVPGMVVLPNPALKWLLAERPRTLDDLAACEDLGAKRIARYGEALLALVGT